MTRQTDGDEYAAGYADAMRDAAARSAKRAIDLYRLANILVQEAGSLLCRAEYLRNEALAFHDAAQNVWAQWDDRRDWQAIVERVAAAGVAQCAEASRPTLTLNDLEPPSSLRSPTESEMRRAAGRAWRV